MITSFEVGTVFKIVDRATPTVRALTRDMTRLEQISASTKKSLQSLGTLSFGNLRKNMGLLTDQAARMQAQYGSTFKSIEAGTDTSIAQTKLLAAEWNKVATAARQAGAAIAGANRSNAPGVIPAQPRSPGAARSALGIHASNGVNLPGGTHLGVRGRGVGGNAAMAGAGLLAYSIYEEAQVEDIAARALMTGQIKVDKGMRQTDAFKRVRDVIQKNAAKTGFSPKEVGEAILTTERQFGGLDFNKRIDLENRILPYAAIEARLKESSLPETFKAMAGLPHMFGKYNPKDQEELMRQFSFASLMTPVPIPQFERALSYSGPILHQGMGMDPSTTMFLTAMTESAGITSTKSGTWIRSFFEKLMPQTGINAMHNAPMHNAMLGQLGLVDKNLQPTWQVKGADGKVDWSESVVKVATMLSTELAKIPDNKRMGYLTGVFGERGGGFGALMNAPEFVAQFPVLLQKMKEWKGGDSGILEYMQGSPVQQGRTAWADTQNVLMDIGSLTLPTLLVALRTFDQLLKDINGPFAWINKKVLGNDDTKDGRNSGGSGFLGAVGDGMLTGGLLGGAAGIWTGPGVAPSFAAGAIAGGVYNGGQYLARKFLPGGTSAPSPESGENKEVPADRLLHKMAYITSGGSFGDGSYSDIGQGRMSGASVRDFGGRRRFSSPASSGNSMLLRTSLGAPGGDGGLSILGAGAGGIHDADGFNKTFSGTALEGQWLSVVAAASANGVSPGLMAAIMAHETGRGSSMSGNNVAGLMDPKTGWSTKQTFGTIGEGISAAGGVIGKNWKKSGGNLNKMAGIYAPKGAKNDPGGLNSNWEKGVRGFLGNGGVPLGQDAALAIAMQHMGQNERTDRGALGNFFKQSGYRVDPATTAWCATFVNSSLAAAGIDGTHSNVATSFMKWGKQVGDLHGVKAGDVLIEHRGRQAGQTGGHVGFATGASRMHNGRFQVEMLSGNDQDSVRKSWRDSGKVMGRRGAEQPPVTIPPEANKDIHVHHTSLLDGRTVAKSTMRHMVGMGNGPARGPRTADYTATRPINV